LNILEVARRYETRSEDGVSSCCDSGRGRRAQGIQHWWSTVKQDGQHERGQRASCFTKSKRNWAEEYTSRRVRGCCRNWRNTDGAIAGIVVMFSLLGPLVPFESYI